MTDRTDASGDGELDAGEFSPWLDGMRAALRGERDADVPCDGCTACCTSSQFVHIAPAEVDALAHIPSELLFPAPRRPRGHVLMGYDQRGRCPMLVDGRCSIYEHRPRTCRTYDCRVFPAAGLPVEVGPAPSGAGDGPPLRTPLAARVARWRVEHPPADDRQRHDAVRAAAVVLRRHPDVGPGGLPPNTTQLAVLAIEAHRAFVPAVATTPDEVVDDPDPAAVRAELER